MFGRRSLGQKRKREEEIILAYPDSHEEGDSSDSENNYNPKRPKYQRSTKEPCVW